MILGAIRELLIATPRVFNLVGRRIYPHNLPQGATLPAVDMRIVSTQPHEHLGGLSKLYSSVVAIDCYTDDDVSLADQVALAIQESEFVGLRGVYYTVDFRGVETLSGITHAVEGVDPGSDRYRHVSSLAFRVHWATCDGSHSQ